MTIRTVINDLSGYCEHMVSRGSSSVVADDTAIPVKFF